MSMVIKMIILDFVLIFGLGSVVRCYPSSKGDSNLIHTNQLIAKINPDEESDIKKPIQQNPIVAKLLKKLDFDPNPVSFECAGLHEFCNFSDWELNNTNTRKKINHTPETAPTTKSSQGNQSTNEDKITSESFQQSTSPNKNEITTKSSPTDDEFQRKNQTVTSEEDQDDGVLTRILLLMILMLQNVFLFVMVLFYRNMKKTGKKCEQRK